MKRSARSIIALAVALLPSAAFAQTASDDPAEIPVAPIVVTAPGAPDPEPTAPPRPALDGVAAPDRDAPRLRFGIAGTLSVGLASGSNYTAGSFGPGVALDIGVQLNDRAAVYLHGEASSMIAFSEAAAYMIAEWTPLNWFSLGSGIGMDGMTLMGSGNCLGTCSRTSGWTGISVPLLAGFNIGNRPGHLVQRSMFRIGIEGAAGLESATGTFGWHTAVMFGFVRM